MLRKIIGSLLGLAALLAAPVAGAEAVKIGTLAPGESPWGQVFKVWQKAVKEKSGGALELTFYWNGQQGDEAAMVGKMKSGQLDGAAITAVGLGTIHKPILVLQLPGLFREWGKLDAARNALKGDFEKAVDDAGFVISGWGDVGLAHAMSKGFSVLGPNDLKGKRPYVWREDPIGPTVYQVIGGVTPVPLGVPEVLPALNTGAIDVVNAPALAAEQLQWASRLTHINTHVTGIGIGALVLTKKKLDSLPGDQKAILLDTGRVAGEALTKRIRGEDAAAFERLKKKMEVATPNDAQIGEWNKIFADVRKRLRQGTFPPALVDKVEGLAK